LIDVVKLLNPVITLLFNCSLHWFKITERIEQKSLQATQPSYLHKLTSVQPPCSTCSSALITLARPPTSSSLWTTDHSFSCASQCLWNQLPHQPHPNLSTMTYLFPHRSHHLPPLILWFTTLIIH